MYIGDEEVYIGDEEVYNDDEDMGNGDEDDHNALTCPTNDNAKYAYSGLYVNHH